MANQVSTISLIGAPAFIALREEGSSGSAASSPCPWQ